MNENVEIASLTIISNVGQAKSNYIEAVNMASKGDFTEADRLMNEGMDLFLEGHKAHAGLISEEAGGGNVSVSLLLMHAEDQLNSAETIHEMALQQISLYRLLAANNIRLAD